MERRVEVEKLRPEVVNESMRQIVCGLLVNGVEFRSREEPNIAKIMDYVYNTNTVQTLQEIASREDSGLYVAQARWRLLKTRWRLLLQSLVYKRGMARLVIMTPINQII